MKNLKIFFLSALVATAGLFTACTEDSDWSAGPLADGPQAYFAADVQTSYTLSAEDTSVTLPVLRVETEGMLDVPVLATVAEGDEGLFNVPSSVAFNDGQNTTTLSVTFDYAELTPGSIYEIALTLDDPTMTTPYGYSNLTVSIAVPEPYVLLGTGLYRDDLVPSIFNLGGFPEYPVEVYENTNTPGFLYMKNPYSYAKGVYIVNASNFHSFEEDVYFAIDVRNPDAVVIPEQPLGLTVDNYGDIWVRMYGDNVGTMKDNIITFAPETMEQAMTLYQGGSYDYLWGNGSGMFRLALPGAVLTDFSVEIEAAGHVADQAGNACPVVNVYGGADVAAVAIEFVEGDITADYASVVAAMAEASTDDLSYATLEMNKDTEKMEGQVTSKKAVATGTVTAVVLPYNADGEAQVDDAVAIAYYFTGCGAEAPACELEAYLFPYTQFWDADEQYSDANSVAIGLMGTEIKYCSFSLWDTESFDYYTAEGYGLDAFVDPDPNGEDAVPADYIDGYINDGGLVMSFRGLPSEMEFILVAWAQNVYGSETYVTSNRLSTTAVAAAAASAKAHFNGQGMLKSMQRVDLNLTWTKREIK